MRKVQAKSINFSIEVIQPKEEQEKGVERSHETEVFNFSP